jgi:hypothetical protein
MTTFLRGLTAAALASAVVAGPAAAASVSVRVEGDATTVVPQTAVRTAPGQVVKDGVHGCDALNAVGALERATAGDWAGTFSPGLGYLVTRIRTETHDAATQSYWRLSVDGADAQSGVCDLALRDGQELVLSPASFAPGATTPSLLEVTAPAAARVGEPVAVGVAALDDRGRPTPRAGATVTAGGASAVTDGQGRAELRVPAAGEVEVRAEAPGTIRDTGERLCVAGPAGGCGLPAVAAPAPAPPVAPAGTPADALAPVALVTSVREGARFPARRAPRALAGVAGAVRRDAAGRLVLAGPDASGLRSVKLRLTRRAGERCSTYSPTRRRFRATRCGAERGTWFAVRAGTSSWRLALASRLPRGRHVLDVKAADGAGNRDETLRRGQNRVVFHVR